jgi:hypothetical protein
VSSVVTDFLYSEKPFATMNMSGGSQEDFIAGFPLARVGYVINGDLANLDSELDNLLGADPLAAARRTAKNYYLGGFPAESYAEGFLAEARRYV